MKEIWGEKREIKGKDGFKSYQSSDDTCRNAVLQEIDIRKIEFAQFVLLGRTGKYNQTKIERTVDIVELGDTYAVWFGNPETGIPIPVEQIKPVINMRRFAWFPGRFDPTSLAIGTKRTLAIV